jgi:hypothetical protein
MEPNERYEQLLCSYFGDRHLVKGKVIVLGCNHFFCKTCLDDHQDPTIICKKCGAVNISDKKIEVEERVVRKLFTDNIGDLFGVIEEKVEEQVYKTKRKLFFFLNLNFYSFTF